jgi:hypothetical protein
MIQSTKELLVFLNHAKSKHFVWVVLHIQNFGDAPSSPLRDAASPAGDTAYPERDMDICLKEMYHPLQR